MTTLELFQELYNNGLLESLRNKQLINKRIANYYQYYLTFIAFSRIDNINRSVIKTAEKYNVDERTIWRALKEFKK